MKSRFNIYKEILHVYYNQSLPLLWIISPSSILKRFFICVSFVGKSFARQFYFKRYFAELSNKNWFFIISTNNYNALRNIKEGIPNSVFLSVGYGRIKNLSILHLYYRSQFFRLFTCSYLWFFYFKRNGNRTFRIFDLIFLAMGSYGCSKEILRYYKPKMIVFANDHNINTRAMILAARAQKIPTVYVQHASVNKFYPPLKFDLSLLEGEYARKTYEGIGKVSGIVKLVGVPKMDAYIKFRNRNLSVNSIGIAVNLNDNIVSVKKFVEFIENNTNGIDIIVRPHPLMNMDVSNFSSKIKFSDSKKCDVFAFLNSIDMLYAGESSIHLEATLMNVISVSVNFMEEKGIDFYGFVENKIVDHCSSFNDALLYLKRYQNNKPDCFHRAKIYNHLVGTNMEGKSTDLAIKYINEFLS